MGGTTKARGGIMRGQLGIRLACTGDMLLSSHPILSPPPLTSPLALQPCHPYACLTLPYASLTGAHIVTPPLIATLRRSGP
eukprot:8401177-Pyramimonas_sp.AAC.1